MPSSAFSEQQLYDDVTSYIRSYYNKAKLLNRSAARFAMSVFQRRLASSTYAILCSLKRREEKLQALIDDIRSGKLDEQQLVRLQQMLDDFDYDAFDEQTADEEESEEGLEGNEAVHDRALGGVLALNLAELEAERQRVDELVELAQRVYNKGEESKFQKLQTIFEHPDYRDQKIIVFTEHRDTLNYLVSRLEGIGHAGHVATIHGAMSYKVREEQREFFRRLPEEGGAQFLVATDAAGEGINLQFCWIMVNFDIPWNPARLEQRMGRIHRYGQAYAADRHSAIYVPYPAFPSVPDSPLIDRQWLYPAHRLSSSTTPTAQYATDVKQNS
jgi:SNF2 family DNA or RNA helicase